MANRLPLIFDSTDNKIKELPSSDNLNLSNSSIVDAINVSANGTISATVGAFTSMTIGGNPIAEVAKTNDYNDLDNLPVLFSGDYNDLTNKPTSLSTEWDSILNKPVIATRLSQLINDTNFVTNSQVTIQAIQVSGLAEVAKSGSWSDLIDANQLVTKSEITGGTLTIDVNNTGDLEGSVYSTNGTLMVDAVNRRFLGPLIGDVVGNLVGNTTGIHTGDVIAGSIFGADSSQLIDSASNTHYGIFQGDLTGNVFGFDSSLLINADNNTVNATLNGNIVKQGSILSLSGVGVQILPNGLFSIPNATNVDINATLSVDIEATDLLSLTSTSGNVNIDGDVIYIGATANGVVVQNSNVSIGKAGGANNFYGTSNFGGPVDASLATYVKVPFYTDATARNTAIPSPERGMIVLTGTSFTGFNGVTWVTF